VTGHESLTPFQLADLMLLAAGVVLWLQLLWMARRSGGITAALRLPAPPEHGLEPVDLLIALVATMALPLLTYALAGRLGSPASTPVSTSGPAEDQLPDATKVVSLTIGQTLAALLLLLIGRQRYPDGLRGWGLASGGLPGKLLCALVGFVVVCPPTYAVLWLTEWLLGILAPGYQPPTHASIRLMQEPGIPGWQSALTVFNALVLAALVEELLFRGLFQPAFARWMRSQWKGIILSAGLFGLTHYPYANTIPALCIFGVALGYLYARTGSLILVVLVHAVFNGKTLLWLLLGAS